MKTIAPKSREVISESLWVYPFHTGIFVFSVGNDKPKKKNIMELRLKGPYLYPSLTGFQVR